MTEPMLDKSVKDAPAYTGRYYVVGRINVCKEITKEIPWTSCTQLVVEYDKEKDEMRIKPLVY